MGDFNGDLGNWVGNKSIRVPNKRGLKLLKFGKCFNLCLDNLLGHMLDPLTPGPLIHFFLIKGDIVPSFENKLRPQLQTQS